MNYTDKYLKQKEYDSVGERTRKVYDILSAYKTAQILSNGSGKDIKCNIVVHDGVDVEAIIGNTYKFNILPNNTQLIINFTIKGYNDVERYLKQLSGMNIKFVDKTKSLGSSIFDFKIFVDFDDIDFESIMELFKLFDIK